MKDNTKVFEEYTVPKAVMTMALPSMLSMLINIVYNLADIFCRSNGRQQSGCRSFGFNAAFFAVYRNG